MNKTGLKECVQVFSVDYNAIDTNNTIDIIILILIML